MKAISEKLITWLKDSVYAAGAKGAVFGMSGGLDSSVVSILCKEAFKEDLLGLIMPCHSNINDEKDAISLAKKFDIKYKVINLDNIYDNIINTIDKCDDKIIKANIKPRLRILVLYYYASLNNYLVIGSENKSEISIGYFTKNCLSDLLPLGNLTKGAVMELGKFLHVPKKILDKTPSAGLWDGQTDEAEMGVSYAQLDNYILTGEAENIEISRKIEKMMAKSKHKRQLPPIPII